MIFSKNMNNSYKIILRLNVSILFLEHFKNQYECNYQNLYLKNLKVIFFIKVNKLRNKGRIVKFIF